MALLLPFRVVVGLDDCADTAKLIFEFVDAFWCDYAIEASDLIAESNEAPIRTCALCRAHHFTLACGGVSGGALCLLI
jgi:hypothetical protein